MSDTEKNPVPPPFDEVPSVDPEPEQAAEQQDERFSGAWLRLALIVLFVAAIGFGQGLGLTLLFDQERGDLSDAVHETAEMISAGQDPQSPHGHPDRVEPEENSVDHDQADHAEGEPATQAAPAVLKVHDMDIARERFDMGDVEWARRTSAAFLLRLDGLGHEDTERSSDAYALLADVLRHEYERSLRGSRQEGLPEAGSQGDQ